MSEQDSECLLKSEDVKEYSQKGSETMNLQLKLSEMLVMIFMVIILVGGGMILGLNLSLRSSETLTKVESTVQRKFELKTGILGVDTLKVNPLEVKLLLDSKPLKIVIKNDKGKILLEKEVEIVEVEESEHELLGEVDENIKESTHVPKSRKELEDADIQRTTEDLPPPKSGSVIKNPVSSK